MTKILKKKTILCNIPIDLIELSDLIFCVASAGACVHACNSIDLHMNHLYYYFWMMMMMMSCFQVTCYINLVQHGLCKSNLPIGYNVTLPVPSSDYNTGFIGRAFFMETDQIPSFKVALSVESSTELGVHHHHHGHGKYYSCSIQVFLGDFKVWNSGPSFFPSQACILELTGDGDLQLKGSSGRIGWRAGTSGQGVERMMLLWTGNLVLMDAKNRIKWQTFDFPTNVILWGQRINFTSRLTAFSGNSTMYYYYYYYSFEIQNNRITLYLNSGSVKYSYWEFRPPNKNRNITYAELGSTGFKFFDQNHRKIAQLISFRRHEPIRFVALRENTGNLGLYHYSPDKRKFEASFQAVNATCDLPLACGSYGVCTFYNSCTCIQFSNKDHNVDPNCNSGLPDSFCGNPNPVEMVDIGSVTSVLRGSPQSLNVVSKEECSNSCISDCRCVAALYSDNGSSGIQHECFHYGIVRGLKLMEKGIGLSYSVKVPKGFGGDSSDGKSNPVKKLLVLIGGVIDGLVILLVLAGVGYYIFVTKKRRLRNENTL